MYGEGEEGEFVARNGVADFFHDLGDGDELVGEAVEPLAGLDDGVGVDDGDGDGIGGVGGGIHQHLFGGLWWRRLLLDDVGPA